MLCYKHDQLAQPTSDSTMTVFVTPDHNLDFVVSDVELIELDAEVNDLEIFADLSGDDYADAVLASI